MEVFLDNLAHALAGTVVAAALCPNEMVKRPARMTLAGVVLANLPDIDLLLALWGKEVYIYHHRGFTHSILGLFLFNLPFGYWLLKKILGKEITISPIRSLVFVYVQITFTHYFLDYLTSYGTLFLYPVMQRFSYPLMFIIDPVFWLITGSGALAVLLYLRQARKRVAFRVKQIALIALALVFTWWTTLTFYKKSAEASLLEKVAVQEVWSYPGPLAPLLWKVLGRDQEGKYHPAVYVASQTAEKKLQFIPIPIEAMSNGLCPTLAQQSLAEKKYLEYSLWAEHSVCTNEIIEEKPGCFCQSLKYSFDPNYQLVAFGAWTIDVEGKTHFTRRGNEKLWDLLKSTLAGSE